MVLIDYRALAVRIQNNYIDITIISAYAYTEHTDQTKRKQWWQELKREIHRLPKRTTTILGIDANGHTGRDPGPGIGSNKEEMWTFSGLQLQILVTETNLVATNTLTNCTNAGPTWFRRDGNGSGRIDYFIIDNKQTNQIIDNHGAMAWDEIGRQGAAIDHKAVMIRRNFKMLQEQSNKKPPSTNTNK